MERQPAVAGQFYPGTKASLEKEVSRLLDHKISPRKVICAIAPHAGYIYSGGVAGKVFASVVVPKKCVVLSPNHTGLGARAAIMTRGEWAIPTGLIPVEEKLANSIIKSCGQIKDDVTAHVAEHSLEVELPFLLARQPGLSIVPLTISHIGLNSCKEIGEAIARAIKASGEEVLIVASTDMNHYEEQKRTVEKDEKAIARVLMLDAAGLLSTCGELRISMCGVVPTAVAIFAAKELGATKATLIEHKTSGDISGDYSAVVGYAGFIIE